MRKQFSIILLCCLLCSLTVSAQEKPRFWDDVQTIKQYDKIYAPPQHSILFIGSSSFRLWNDLERTFASYTVLNRAIGGAVVNDIIFYTNDLILPYHPRQIFIYVGENDLFDAKTTGDSIFQRTKRLLVLIRSQLPDVPIVYVSMKPSPLHEKDLKKMVLGNTLIRDYIAKQTAMTFVDVYKLMITPDGKPQPGLFRDDHLHMNSQGYAIWEKELKPLLLKQ